MAFLGGYVGGVLSKTSESRRFFGGDLGAGSA